MKFFVILLILITLSSLMIPNVSAICAADGMEWWEPCNDAGQNDILSFKATLIVIVLVIVAISIVFFVVKKWRK